MGPMAAENKNNLHGSIMSIDHVDHGEEAPLAGELQPKCE